MTGQTVILAGDSQRHLAAELIQRAPSGAVVNIREATRTLDQNAKMHAMLSDVARAKPMGRSHTADVWKAIFMNACGHQVQFVEGLEGEPFPIGFRSSRLTKRQMSDLIEYMLWFGTEHGVVWSDSAYAPDKGEGK